MSDSDECPELVEKLNTVPRIQKPPAEGTGGTQKLDRPRVPVNILTGFLGSGKSTLLRYILSAKHDSKIAVVMNEFGDTAEVEKMLGLSAGGLKEDAWLSLENGCMCCISKDRAVVAIEAPTRI